MILQKKNRSMTDFLCFYSIACRICSRQHSASFWGRVSASFMAAITGSQLRISPFSSPLTAQYCCR